MCFVLCMLLVVQVALIDSQKVFHGLLAQIISNSRRVLNTTSSKCKEQMTHFALNLATDSNSWSLQMLDASGKTPSGLLTGNFYDPGDFKECVNIKVSNNTSGEILGKYCFGSVYISGSVNNSFSALWGLCMPDGCSAQDVNAIANDPSFNFPMKIHFQEEYCQTIDDVEKELDGEAISTISFLMMLLFGFLVITLYELYYVIYGKKNYHPIIKELSFYSNCKKIFKMNKPSPDRFSSLNGIRFLSILFVVYFHSFAHLLRTPVRNLDDVMDFLNGRISLPVFAAQYSVDTFFVLASALMTYNFLKARFNMVHFNICTHYVHRYLRLTPSLAMVILVHTTLIKYMGSGPQWPLLNLVAIQNCQKYWWSALLYIQNFVNWDNNQCLIQSWYLTVEMQLFIFSPVFLYLLWKYPNIGLSILSVATVSSISYTFYLAWKTEPYAMPNTVQYMLTQNKNYIYYSLPARASSWTIGMILGHYLFQVKQDRSNFKSNKILLFCLWFICLATIVTCITAGYDTLRGPEYNKWGHVLYITLVRPSWCLAISWIIFACCSEYGGPINWLLSFPIFEVLAKFSYSIYLIHLSVLDVITYSSKTSAEFGLFILAYNFWSITAFSIFLSFFLIVMVELPVAAIDKIIFSNINN